MVVEYLNKLLYLYKKENTPIKSVKKAENTLIIEGKTTSYLYVSSKILEKYYRKFVKLIKK